MTRASTLEELEKMRVAEDVVEKRWQRRRRTARIFSVSQALVGYVALAGFFANAYQNYNTKRQAEARAEQEDARWAREFKRAQDADKYRAFFETSALATDPHNADKRLVGYALLKEFVDDKDYNAKATFMLEESLSLELRDDNSPGLDEPHRAAVTAILTALSHTSDCKALDRAAHTIDKLALRHAQKQDVDEASEVLGLYVLRIVGRSAVVCQPKGLLEARRPIRDFLVRQPDLAGISGRPTPADADRKIVDILRGRIADEAQSGISDDADVLPALKKSCDALAKDKVRDADGLCGAVPAKP